MKHTSLILLAATAAACSPSYDLELVLDRAVVPVGEPVVVTLSGVVDAPRATLAEVEIALSGDGTDTPEVEFETLAATPSGRAHFLDGRNAADNSSPAVLFSLIDPGEEVRVKWNLWCGTPGEWTVFGGLLLQASGSGAPLFASDDSHVADVVLTCE